VAGTVVSAYLAAHNAAMSLAGQPHRTVDVSRGVSLNLDLGAEFDDLSAGTPKKAAERSALRCRKANSVSRHTHIPGTSSLGMMVSRDRCNT